MWALRVAVLAERVQRSHLLPCALVSREVWVSWGWAGSLFFWNPLLMQETRTEPRMPLPPAPCLGKRLWLFCTEIPGSLSCRLSPVSWGYE